MFERSRIYKDDLIVFYGRRKQVLHTMQLIIMNFLMVTDGKEVTVL